MVKKTKEQNGWKFLVCFKIVLSVPGQEVKCSKKAVGVFKTSPSSLSYRLRLGQERLPELYKLEQIKLKYVVVVQNIFNHFNMRAECNS